MSTSPWNPIADWDVIRQTPEGAALADAYLTLRYELNTLITYCQGAETGNGMSVKALREHAERLIPLLEVPYGKAWTEAYWEMRVVKHQIERPLREHIALVKRGKHHDWLVPEALKTLEEMPS